MKLLLTIFLAPLLAPLCPLDAAQPGQKLWEFQTGDSIYNSSPAIGADGTVYIGSGDGKLYALYSSSVGGLAQSPWPKFRGNAQNTGRVTGPSIDIPPSIDTQSSPAILKEGNQNEITALVSGQPAPQVQWFFNGAAIPGGAYATLILPAATRAQEGTYWLIVSNALGQATSAPIAAVVSNVDPGRFVGLQWPGKIDSGLSLESTDRLGPGAVWHTLSNYPPAATEQRFVELKAVGARFYRLSGSGASPRFTQVGFLNGWRSAAPIGTQYQIDYTAASTGTNWLLLTNLVLPASPYLFLDYESLAGPARVYYTTPANVPPDTNAPTGMVLIPAGSFTMGDTFNDWPSDWGTNPEIPAHTVYVSAFYMDRYEVTKALRDEVYTWAVAHGYSFDNAGWGKAANHPVHSVNWYDVVKWCNARSEKESRVPAYYTDAAQKNIYKTGAFNVPNDWVKWNAGYRLPTDAEWEKAARGGASGHRFPWSNVDTITHSQANYYSDTSYPYDVSSTRGYHPSYQSGGYPYTSPVGSFAPNGYGLYDMAGNVWEWCWDWYDESYYSSSPGSDPRGLASGSLRVVRGGGYYDGAIFCRVAFRSSRRPIVVDSCIGFRSVLPPGQ